MTVKYATGNPGQQAKWDERVEMKSPNIKSLPDAHDEQIGAKQTLALCVDAGTRFTLHCI